MAGASPLADGALADVITGSSGTAPSWLARRLPVYVLLAEDAGRALALLDRLHARRPPGPGGHLGAGHPRKIPPHVAPSGDGPDGSRS
jgi:hypothetical protein